VSDPLLQPDSPDREEERALAAFGSEAVPVRRAAAGQTGLAPWASDEPSDADVTAGAQPALAAEVADAKPPRVPWWHHHSLAIAPLWLAVAAVGGAAAGIGYARYLLPSSPARRTLPAVESRTGASQPINPPVAAPPDQAVSPPTPAAPPDAQAAQSLPLPPPPGSPVEPRVDRERARDQRAIRALLEAYRQAYERLDPSAVAALWPDVDSRALERTFASLSHQQITFDRCEITITGAAGVARCEGTLATTQIGDTDPQSRQMVWAFAFERTGDWRLSGVNAR
jgi:hypothetical protein